MSNEIVESYRKKFDETITRVKLLTQNFAFEQRITAVDKAKLKFPKIKLVKLGGEIRDWFTFWSPFSRIPEDKSLKEVDKFDYLIQCMSLGRRAKEIIDSYPPTAQKMIANFKRKIRSRGEKK